MAAARIFADHNATSPLRPEAKAAMLAVWDAPGNGSSVHTEGRAARRVIEAARETLGRVLEVPSRDLVLTGGATEASQLAVEAALSASPDLVLIGAAEHDALWAYVHARCSNVEVVPINATGQPDLSDLAERLEGAQNPLVILQSANNETGAVLPVASIAKLVRAANGRLIVDAVQSFGKLPVSQFVNQADWTIVSSHKIGGPLGAGALIVRTGSPEPNSRPGGGQERGRRAGTENGAALAGFAAAAEAAYADLEGLNARAIAERDRFEALVTAAFPQAHVFARRGWSVRLANTSCIGLPGWSGETAVMALDLVGVAVSAGAACSSGKVGRSRTLAAMISIDSGLDPDLARCAVRVSFGWNSDVGDGERVAAAYILAAERVTARLSA
jgi:cysteine desulfurase